MRTTRLSGLDRTKAGKRARGWLEGVAIPTSQAAALQRFGLLLCDCIEDGIGGPIDLGSPKVRLPAPSAFVGLSRGELLSLTQTIALSNAGGRWISAEQGRRWAQFFGAVALSYARLGDIPVVAVLVRSAAHLRLCGDWLIEAEIYLLDQQRPDGGFGLIASELAFVEEETEKAEALLRLTVDVLWALAETKAFGLTAGSTVPRPPAAT